MAQIQRIKTGDTNWGDEATKLNTNFNQLNQNKVEAVPGSRLITKEEAQKLNDLQNLEQPNLNETDPSSFAYVKGQEKIQLIMKAQELQNPPTPSTLIYQVNGETFSYKIGQFVRAIVDVEPKIYQLYNIVNGSAVWKEVNTGSGGGGEVSGYAEGFSWYELTNPGDIKPVNGITLSKSLVTYTIAESGITGDTTNIYSLIVWDPTDATDKTVTYKASAGLTGEINEGVIANITAEPGDYTITITTVDGSHTATLNVKIQPSEPANVPVESISVSKSEVEIDTNNEGGIDVSQYITVFPDDATDKSVTYEISNSDSKYATVSSSGIVTAKSINGSFTVKVKSVSNPEVVATINMEAYTTLTGISKLNDMVIEGQNQSATFRISIIPTYANRYDPFTVQSLNPDIASVRDSGADTYTVTSVGLGTTQILVTNGPISEQFDVTVQRANITVKKITLSEQNKSMIADDEFTLTATVEPTDATEEIDWSVTPSNLLAVSYPNNKTANIIALLKVGTAIVSAANKDRSSVATCTIQCSGGISVVSLNFQSVQGSHNLCVVSILKYPNKTARENSRDDYGDFTPTSQSIWIIKNATESTVMSVTISGEECLGINQTASKAIWRIDGVFQSGRTGTVDCDNELHSIQFNGG
jgi:hypothetical protein